MSTSLPNIVACKQGMKQYVDKIDKIQMMLDRINSDMKALEQNIAIAEEELGYNDTKLSGFFKPFLKKVVGKDAKPTDDNEEKVLVYKPVETFKTTDYFPDSAG